MFKKSLIAFFTILIIVNTFTLFLRDRQIYGESSTVSNKSETKPVIKLKVGYIPIAECAHLYVGIAKKYFEQEGIDVELVQMSGGSAILPILQKGDLDIGFTNIVSLIIQDSKLTKENPYFLISLIGASYERPGYSNHALLIRKDSNINVTEMANSRTRFAINTTRNIEELMLRRFLKKKNIQAKKLNLITTNFPGMLSALDRKDVDIASVVEPFIEPALRVGKFSLFARQYLEVSPETLVATYAVTKRWISANRKTAIKFIQAFKKADAFIKNNDAETRQIIGSFTKIRKEDIFIIGIPAFDICVKRDALQQLIDEILKYKFSKTAPKPEDLISELNGD